MRQSQPRRFILVGAICVIVGLMVGAGLGLLLSRRIEPPGQSNTAFADLGAETKEEYIVLVGAAYAQDHDLEKAKVQLAVLGAPNINHWIASLVDRYVAEGGDPADLRALAELAHGLGVGSPAVLAHVATPTPLPTGTLLPTNTPLPTLTPAPTDTRAPTSIPPTEAPTATPQPTDTPTTLPSDTPIPATPTATPANTDTPQPTNTSKPQPPPTAAPTNTPKPANTPAVKWVWAARLVGPGEDGQQCRSGPKMIRVTVLDAAGAQIPGIWINEQYTSRYQVSGHKGDDPFWGPGEVEFSALDGGRLCVATGEGGPCESGVTRDLPLHDPPPFEDMWAAGYCECCEPEITRERCQELYDAGECLGIEHYMWRVQFQRSW